MRKVLLLFAIGLIAIPGIFIKDIVEGQVVSGPVSYANRDENALNERVKRISDKLSATRYTGGIYAQGAFQLSSEDISIDIVPLAVTRFENPLKIMDDFILEAHGTAQIMWQGEVNNQVSRMYNLHADHFEIFTLVMSNTRALVLHTEIDANSIDELEANDQYILYKDVISNANILLEDTSLNYRKPNPKEIKQNIRELHESINYDFIKSL